MASKPRPVFTDPLDAAKIAAPAAPAAPPALPDPAPGESAAPEVEPTLPTGEPAPRPPHFRIEETKRIPWRDNMMITLTAGDVVSDESYGPGSMDRMRDCGAKLVECEPKS